MLILSRKLFEQIIIGDEIEITVTRISGNRVTLGVKAPESYRIVRGEIDDGREYQPRKEPPK